MEDLFDTYQYPPYFFLLQVSEHCPKAVSTYLLLWRKADDNFQIQFNKKNIREELLISVAKFRHDLLLLVKEMLISIEETPTKIFIELVKWDDVTDERYGN